MLTADLREDVPMELQAGLRLMKRGDRYVLQVLAFVGPKLGYEWTDIQTVEEPEQ